MSALHRELKSMGKEMNKQMMKRQIKCPVDLAVDGTLSGSWPLHGPYDTLYLSNHSAKFFIDALNFEGSNS
jgi:hypothetical protein